MFPNIDVICFILILDIYQYLLDIGHRPAFHQPIRLYTTAKWVVTGRLNGKRFESIGFLLWLSLLLLSWLLLSSLLIFFCYYWTYKTTNQRAPRFAASAFVYIPRIVMPNASMIGRFLPSWGTFMNFFCPWYKIWNRLCFLKTLNKNVGARFSASFRLKATQSYMHTCAHVLIFF